MESMYCKSCKATCSPEHDRLTNAICIKCPETCKDCFYWEFRGGQEALKLEKDFTICKKCKVKCDQGAYGACTKCTERCPECIYNHVNNSDIHKYQSILDEGKRDPEYSEDKSQPEPPDLKKTKRSKVQKQIHRYTFMYSAYAFKLKAAIVRLGQTKKLKPKCTSEDCLDMSHRIRKYNYQYQKENFLSASKHKIYWTKLNIKVVKKQLDECCDCLRLEPAACQNIKRYTVSYIRDLGEVWDELLVVSDYAKQHGFEIEIPFTLKDIHNKLYDDSLSQKDLDAILDCILLDNEAKKTEKTVSKDGRAKVVKHGRNNPEKERPVNIDCGRCNPPERPGVRKTKVKKGNSLRKLLQSATIGDLNNLGA